jgi:hypothetical protein
MTDSIVSDIEFTRSLPGVSNPEGFVRCTVNLRIDLTIVRTANGRRIEFPEPRGRRGGCHALPTNSQLRAAIEREILAATPEVEA